ncbi:hypothetical protein BBJ28_00005036 [Nothophytophthora sp. Chile5]|nr:hypothetical protein BBJ28_00005036 [Nothophytophthora sp. Chile5]
MQFLATKLRPSALARQASRLAASRASACRSPLLLTAARATNAWLQPAASLGGVARLSSGDKGPFARSHEKKQQVSDDDGENKPVVELSRLAVIGGGNMAEAILTGMLAEGLIPSSKVMVSDPNPAMRKKYDTMDVATCSRNSSAVKGADVILVAVKPQVLDDVLRNVKAAMDPEALVISVVAGPRIKQLQMILGEDSHVIRTMPNTPAMIGEGTTVWAQSGEVTSVQHDLTKAILGSFGVESENVHPVVLRNNITSPGGTTAAGLYRAEKNGFRAVIADSIWAAYERCLELGSSEHIQRKRPRS